MTMQHASFGRHLSFISLAMMALVGQAQAAVDFGRTIDAVTTNTVTTYSPYNGYSEPTSYSTTTATIVSRPSVVDTQTGLQWIKASTLAEGEALGYRAATTSEFQSFVTHSGWAPLADSSQTFALPSGFSYVESRTSGTSMAGYSSTVRYTNNLAPVSFSTDVSVLGPSPYGSSITQAVSVAWLDGVAGGSVGAMFTSTLNNYMPICSGARSTSCSTSDNHSNEAAVGALSDLQAGAYDSASHTTGSNWSALMNQLPQAEGSTNLMYYMVAVAVPEPSSYALMGLGLIGVAAAARRQRRA